MEPKRAILLDMDGLLLDTERISCRSFLETSHAMGLSMTRQMYVRLIGLRHEDTAGMLREILGPQAPVDELIERTDARYAELIETERVPLRPKVDRLLDFLDAHKWARAVATSTHTERARQKLGKAGILPRLGRVVGGDQVARGKPFPDIYLKAAEPFGLPPGDIVVLEDSRAGVLGGSSAGMRVMMIPDMQPPRKRERELAAAVFPDLGAFVEAALRGRI